VLTGDGKTPQDDDVADRSERQDGWNDDMVDVVANDLV